MLFSGYDPRERGGRGIVLADFSFQGPASELAACWICAQCVVAAIAIMVRTVTLRDRSVTPKDVPARASILFSALLGAALAGGAILRVG